MEADHRRHAEVENARSDLKYRVGLNHMPSGPPSVDAGLAGRIQLMTDEIELLLFWKGVRDYVS